MDSEIADLAIAKGSLVIVTGANGYIGSNVVDQLLTNGYRVRGTVRKLEKSRWMVPLLEGKYGTGNFELVEVPDMAAAGAFDGIVKGASGFIHVATPVMQSYDPNEAVPMVVNGILHVLQACYKESGIKRVVMTSSSTAAANPQPNKVFTMDEKTWNTSAVEAAWAPPPYEGLQRRLDVYSASKTQSEQAAWKFMEEQKPGFVLNTVLPNANIGHILSVEHQGYPSTAGWVRALWDGFEGHKDLEYNPPQYYINVQDNARVHVAALIFPDVNGERLFSFAYPFNWNDILAVFRKLYPGRKFIDDYPNLGRDLSKVSNGRAEELVKRMGRPRWESLEASVKAVTDTIVVK
jgi:nucleoside-diphosphate-sugar epimerase